MRSSPVGQWAGAWITFESICKGCDRLSRLPKRVLKADIGMRRYFSYAVLDTIKHTDMISETLIKRSDLAK